MSDPAEGGVQLRRVLGPVDSTCIVVGAIIGVGIFFTPSTIAQIAGSTELVLVTWAVGGVIAMLGALTFAELGALYPRTGAQYEILRDSYGPLPAFLFVFCNATAIQAGATAIIALVCAQHLGQVFGAAELEPIAATSIAAVLIIGLAGANIIGVKYGSGIQNATVFAKVLTLLVVTVIAAVNPGTPETAAEAATVELAAAPTGLAIVPVIFAALVPAFFAFGGWQHALWISGEVREPRRNVPLALIVGVGIVVTVYMLVNWAYLRLLGVDGVAESSTLASDAVAVAFPDVGRRVVAGAVAVSAFGVLNAQLLSGPRLVHAMARDGRFFAPFAAVHERFRTPLPAIALISVTALVLLVAAGANAINTLVTGVVLIDGVFFALTGAALIVLRRKRHDAERPVRVPLYPVVPILFILGEIGIVAGAYLDPNARVPALIGAAWILAAAVCWWLFFRRDLRNG